MKKIENIITKQKLAKVLENYFNKDNIEILDFKINNIWKPWGINANFAYIEDVIYNNGNNSILPNKFLVKKYKSKLYKITTNKEIDVKFKYLNEKLIYSFLDENTFYEDYKTKIPLVVTCYNNKYDIFDNDRILIFNYGGEENEKKLIDLGREIRKNESLNNLNKEIKTESKNRISELEEEIKKIMEKSLKSTSFLHLKLIENQKKLDDLEIFKPSKEYYQEGFLRYINNLFTAELYKENGSSKTILEKSSMILANYLSGNNEKTCKFLSAIHGDLNNRNILDRNEKFSIFCDLDHFRKALLSFDVAKQTINDTIYLKLDERKKLIEYSYINTLNDLLKDTEFKDLVIDNKKHFVGTVLISSLFEILKTSMFIKKV